GENVVGRFRLFSHWRIPILLLFLPQESEENVVGCFCLFSHWRDPDITLVSTSGIGRAPIFSGVGEKVVGWIPKFFLSLPRESGKMLWDVFASSPTGGSRFSSCFSLGSRGKFCLSILQVVLSSDRGYNCSLVTQRHIDIIVVPFYFELLLGFLCFFPVLWII
ncbi:hypothetical protein L9F63_023325, partial [Diploptera punctata]